MYGSSYLFFFCFLSLHDSLLSKPTSLYLPYNYHVCQRGDTPADAAREDGHAALLYELEKLGMASSLC